MKTFMDKDERQEESKWKTAFVVVQDKDGRVFVDNSMSNFNDIIEKQASINDGIYMLQTALNEFQEDKTIERLKTLIQGALSDGV